MFSALFSSFHKLFLPITDGGSFCQLMFFNGLDDLGKLSYSVALLAAVAGWPSCERLSISSLMRVMPCAGAGAVSYALGEMCTMLMYLLSVS